MRVRAVHPMLHPLFWAFPLCAAVAPATGCETAPRPRPKPPVSIATLGASQSGVVTDVQDQVLARSASQEAEPAGAGAAAPSGRLGETWHSAYIDLQPGPWPGYKSQTAEASVIGSGYYTFPQSVLGGSVQAGAFGGEDWVSTTYKVSSLSSGAMLGVKTYNHSSVAGGYVLYSLGRNYAMSTVSVFEGTTGQTGAAFAGSSSSYGTRAFTGTTVAGHIFDLDGMARPLKLDVRGGLLYSNANGGQFSDSVGQLFRPSLQEWTGALSATLFEDFALSSSAALRPYLKATVKEQLSYSNKLDDYFQGVWTAYRFGQNPTLGSAEIGLDYKRPGVTVTGAVYGEGATDQGSLGGRLGAKFAF